MKTEEFYVGATPEDIATFQALPNDTPINMLNLIRFRPHAAYPEEHSHASLGLSGSEAYEKYGLESKSILERLGGGIVWRGKMEAMLIGPSDEHWDAAFIAYYPNSATFLTMVADTNYQLAFVHRQAAVLTSRLVRFAPMEAIGGFA